MKTILVVFLLVLPLVMAATVPYDGLSQEEIEKRMSIGTIIGILKSLDLGPGCVEVCEKHVHGYWRYLCSGACNVILG